MRSSVAILLLACTTFASAAVGAETEALQVVGPETIEVDSNSPKRKTLTLRNGSPAPVVATLSAVLDEGSAAVDPPEIEVPGRQVKRTAVLITPDKTLETVGALLVTAPDSAPLVIPLTINPSATYGNDFLILLFAPLLVAVLRVVTIWWGLKDRWRILARKMGPAEFDFTKAYSSGLTVVTSAVAAFLALGVIPDDTKVFPKNGYLAFAAIFALLALVAPFMFLASQTVTPKAGKEPLRSGRVFAFLLAATVTLWGVLGGLAVVALLVWEIEQAGTLPAAALWFIWVLLAVLALLVLMYSTRTIRAITDSQRVPRRRPRRKKRRAIEEEELAVDDLEALPAWTPF